MLAYHSVLQKADTLARGRCLSSGVRGIRGPRLRRRFSGGLRSPGPGMLASEARYLRYMDSTQ